MWRLSISNTPSNGNSNTSLLPLGQLGSGPCMKIEEYQQKNGVVSFSGWTHSLKTGHWNKQKRSALGKLKCGKGTKERMQEIKGIKKTNKCVVSPDQHEPQLPDVTLQPLGQLRRGSGKGGLWQKKGTKRKEC